VFLLALCFSILVESLKRFYSLEPIENPMLVFIVGFVGLAVNVIGLLLFAGHGHGHHHHGHGHGHGHNHQPTRQVGDSSAPTVTHSSSSLRLRESRKRNSSPNAGDVPMRGANAYVLKEGADVLADLSEDQCEQVRFFRVPFSTQEPIFNHLFVYSSSFVLIFHRVITSVCSKQFSFLVS
jgi:hypothetical protein